MQRFIDLFSNSHFYETLLIGISGLTTIHLIEVSATQLALSGTQGLLFSAIDLALRAAVATVTIYTLLRKRKNVDK